MNDVEFYDRYTEPINWIVAELLLLLTNDVPQRRRDDSLRRLDAARVFLDQLETQMNADYAAGHWYRP